MFQGISQLPNDSFNGGWEVIHDVSSETCGVDAVQDRPLMAVNDAVATMCIPLWEYGMNEKSVYFFFISAGVLMASRYTCTLS